MSKTDTQVVVEVLFPKTGVFWEYGGYFSRDDGGDMNSAIDVIREAQAKGFSSLSLKLLHPWPEEVDLTATSTDIGKEGSLKLGNTNSPALVTLDGGGREIALKAGTGSVITVGDGVTLTLRNITFKGSAANNVPLIKVESGGTLVLEDGAVITGNNNTNSIGGGVYVGGGGALVMNGGAISGNTSSATGGMFNGGGGVYLLNSTFTMDGGKISGNTTAKYGGGVGLYDKSTFTMNKGVISGNTGIRGGGVDNFWGTFTMYGGIIYGKEDAHGDKKNTASGGSGAAVYNDSTARWNEKKDGVLETLNTTDATLDLR
jgi:hypothetical protein